MKQQSPVVSKTAYEILGVEDRYAANEEIGSPVPGFDEEIRARYRKLALGNSHPDKGGNAKKWSEITSAFNAIKNSQARKANGNLRFEVINEIKPIPKTKRGFKWF